MTAVPTRDLCARALLWALLWLTLGATSAQAQGKVTAHYAISMTGVTIGEINWQIEIGDTLYRTSASGKASGVLSVLMNGEGEVAAQGTVGADALTPKSYISTITDDDGTITLRMTFAEGVASETMTPRPPERKDRLPLTEADRRDVADPLSAVLLVTSLGGGTLAASDCGHTLKIFDGRRRFDLLLSYARMEKIEIGKGYRGPVLVCSVVLKPLAGYLADSMIVKYVAGRRNMELWFAPVAGTSIVAPVRVLMPTPIGTLKIDADQFVAVAVPPMPAPVQTAPLPPPQ